MRNWWQQLKAFKLLPRLWLCASAHSSPHTDRRQRPFQDFAHSLWIAILFSWQSVWHQSWRQTLQAGLWGSSIPNEQNEQSQAADTHLQPHQSTAILLPCPPPILPTPTHLFHIVWQMHALGQGAAFAHLVQSHCSKISFILTGWRLKSSIKDTANFRDKREHTGITAWSQQSLQHLTQPFLTILSNSLLMLWITSNSLWWNSYLLKTKNRWLPCFVDPYSDVSVSFPFHSIITFHFK